MEGFVSNLYDILLPDISEKDLYNVVGPALKTKYLDNTQRPYDKEALGVIWGPNKRLFVT